MQVLPRPLSGPHGSRKAYPKATRTHDQTEKPCDGGFTFPDVLDRFPKVLSILDVICHSALQPRRHSPFRTRLRWSLSRYPRRQLKSLPASLWLAGITALCKRDPYSWRLLGETDGHFARAYIAGPSRRADGPLNTMRALRFLRAGDQSVEKRVCTQVVIII